MRSALSEPNQIALHSNSNTMQLRPCTTCGKVLLILYENKRWNIKGDPLPTKSPLRMGEMMVKYC